MPLYIKSVDWRLEATSIVVIYYYYFVGLGKTIFHVMEKTLLSSLWNATVSSLSDADLLYHQICTNVHAQTPLPVKSPASMVSKWNTDISSGRAGQMQTGQS